MTCATGDPQCPVPLALAEKSGQRLQMEFLLHNKTSGKGCPHRRASPGVPWGSPGVPCPGERQGLLGLILAPPPARHGALLCAEQGSPV